MGGGGDGAETRPRGTSRQSHETRSVRRSIIAAQNACTWTTWLLYADTPPYLGLADKERRIWYTVRYTCVRYYCVLRAHVSRRTVSEIIVQITTRCDMTLYIYGVMYGDDIARARTPPDTGTRVKSLSRTTKTKHKPLETLNDSLTSAEKEYGGPFVFRFSAYERRRDFFFGGGGA